MSDDRFKVDPDRFVFDRRAFLKGALAAPVVVPAVVAAIPPTVSTAHLPVVPAVPVPGVYSPYNMMPMSASYAITMSAYTGTCQKYMTHTS